MEKFCLTGVPYLVYRGVAYSLSFLGLLDRTFSFPDLFYLITVLFFFLTLFDFSFYLLFLSGHSCSFFAKV